MEIRTDKPEQKSEVRKSYMKFLSNVKNPKKNATNPFAKNKYADLSSVLKAVKEAQKDTGLMFFQDIGAENGNMITCQSYFISEHGEIVFSPFRMPTGKADSQAVGSAETYARRYDAEAACGITAEPDDDGNASTNNYSNQNNSYSRPQNQSNNQQGSSNFKTRKANEKQLNFIKSLAQQSNRDDFSNKDAYDKSIKLTQSNDALHELTSQQASKFISFFQNK